MLGSVEQPAEPAPGEGKDGSIKRHTQIVSETHRERGRGRRGTQISVIYILSQSKFMLAHAPTGSFTSSHLPERRVCAFCPPSFVDFHVDSCFPGDVDTAPPLYQHAGTLSCCGAATAAAAAPLLISIPSATTAAVAAAPTVAAAFCVVLLLVNKRLRCRRRCSCFFADKLCGWRVAAMKFDRGKAIDQLSFECLFICILFFCTDCNCKSAA